MTFMDSDGAGGQGWGNPDEAMARVTEQIAEAQARAEQAQVAQAQIAAVRGSGTSPGGEVTVEVDASGRLTGIDFDSGSRSLRPDDLSKAVLKAAAIAQRQAGERAIGIASDSYGEDSPAVAHLRGEVDERMPADPDDDALGYR